MSNQTALFAGAVPPAEHKREPEASSVPTISLWEHQAKLISEVRKAMAAGHKRVVMQSPTGSGKSRASAAIAASAISKGNTVLFNVYGRTLVSQGAREFKRLNLPVGVIMAGQPYKKSLPLQVSSVDTIASRVDDMDWFKPDLIITDEAHESLSDKFQLVRELWPDAFEILLTATPQPTSGKGMKEVADALVPGPSYQKLIDDGVLVRPRFITTDESEAQLLKVNYASGEFSNKSNEAAFNDAVVLGRIVERWVEHGEGRPTVLYAASVAHSMELTEQFNKAGYSWAHVDANTPDEERQEYYAQLATGELRGISNFGILGRGWDCPPVSCVILARAIRHITNYIQIIGRAMRASPGKVDCLVLDMAENYWRGHGDFVLDPVEWSLDGSSISDLMKQRKEVLEAEAYHCPACHAVIRGKSCANCGFVVPPKPPKPSDTAEGDGTLKEVTGSPNRRAKTDGVARKRQVYEQLLGLGVERGWEKWKGRAYYLYKEYYGVFPAGVVQKGAGVVSPGWEIRRWHMEYEQRRRAARAAKKREGERGSWS